MLLPDGDSPGAVDMRPVCSTWPDCGEVPVECTEKNRSSYNSDGSCSHCQIILDIRRWAERDREFELFIIERLRSTLKRLLSFNTN